MNYGKDAKEKKLRERIIKLCCKRFVNCRKNENKKVIYLIHI